MTTDPARVPASKPDLPVHGPEAQNLGSSWEDSLLEDIDGAVAMDPAEISLRRQRIALLTLSILGFIALCIICPLSYVQTPPPESPPQATAQPSSVDLTAPNETPKDPALAQGAEDPEKKAPPAFRATLLGGRVTLLGALPDEVVKGEILTRVRGLYGDGHVVDQLRVSPTILQRPYLASLGQATSLLAFLRGDNAITLQGDTLLLAGEVETISDKEDLLKKARSTLGTAASGLRFGDRIVVKQVVKLQEGINAQLVGKTVEFAPNSAELTPAGLALLQQLLPALRQAAAAGILIAGHTDNQGADELNLALSQRRAQTVARFLIGEGIPEGQLKTLGHGPKKPIASNDTPEGRQKNRRIEFILSPKEAD